MPRHSSLPPSNSSFNPITGETKITSNSGVNDSLSVGGVSVDAGFSGIPPTHSRSNSANFHRTARPFPIVNSKGMIDEFGTGLKLSPTLARTSFDSSFKLSEENAAHWQENQNSATKSNHAQLIAAQQKRRVLRTFQSSPDFPLPATTTDSSFSASSSSSASAAPACSSLAARPATPTAIGSSCASTSASVLSSNPTFQSTLSLTQIAASAPLASLSPRFHSNNNSRYTHTSKHAQSSCFSTPSATRLHTRSASFDDLTRHRIQGSRPPPKWNASGDISILPVPQRRDVNVGHSDMLTLPSQVAQWRTDDFCREKNEKESAKKPPKGKARVASALSAKTGEETHDQYSHTKQHSSIIRAESPQADKPRWK